MDGKQVCIKAFRTIGIPGGKKQTFLKVRVISTVSGHIWEISISDDVPWDYCIETTMPQEYSSFSRCRHPKLPRETVSYISLDGER